MKSILCANRWPYSFFNAVMHKAQVRLEARESSIEIEIEIEIAIAIEIDSVQVCASVGLDTDTDTDFDFDFDFKWAAPTWALGITAFVFHPTRCYR
jgi:hypothetical protein